MQKDPKFRQEMEDQEVIQILGKTKEGRLKLGMEDDDHDEKDAMEKYSGRGEVKWITRTPELAKEKTDHRNSWDKKAEKQLSQARRCEQVAYRI